MLIQEYLQWSERINRREPRVENYHNHILALRTLGKKKEADKYLIKARRLFNHHKLFLMVLTIKLKSFSESPT